MPRVLKYGITCVKKALDTNMKSIDADATFQKVLLVNACLANKLVSALAVEI